jgi:predicted O-methyltransferase YrrM
MEDKKIIGTPINYQAIKKETDELNFTMASDLFTGSLLKTLAASKASAKFLELGAGSGLATSWIVSGMDKNSSLLAVENDAVLIEIAKKYVTDSKVEFLLTDAYSWIENYNGEGFDFIFADAMPGKYDLFDKTIAMLKNNGLYIIDDMLPQPNWPVGHDEKVATFINMLEKRDDLFLTKMNWSTGIIIVSKN